MTIEINKRFLAMAFLIVPLILLADELAAFSDEALDFILAADGEILEAISDDRQAWLMEGQTEVEASHAQKFQEVITSNSATTSVNPSGQSVSERLEHEQ